MAASPPASPASPQGAIPQRPMSMMIQPRPVRSASRMSVSGARLGTASRFSDEDGKTAVKVGECQKISYSFSLVRLSSHCTTFVCATASIR